MKFRTEHHFDAPPDAVAAVLTDPEFHSGLQLPDLGLPEILEHTAATSKTGETRLRMRYQWVGDLDPVVRKLLRGRDMTWIQDVRLTVATGRGHLHFEAEADPKRLHGDADVVLEADGRRHRAHDHRGPDREAGRHRFDGGTPDRARSHPTPRRGSGGRARAPAVVMTGTRDELPAVEIVDVASTADADELRDSLFQYNYDATGYTDGRSLSCFLRDADGRLVAGIDGFTWGGYARIEYLWVAEERRGQGLGRELLQAAEREAAARGCVVVQLDSHSFQAPDLYRRFGYTEIGYAADTPVGHGQYFFTKRLVDSDAPRPAAHRPLNRDRRAPPRA